MQIVKRITISDISIEVILTSNDIKIGDILEAENNSQYQFEVVEINNISATCVSLYSTRGLQKGSVVVKKSDGIEVEYSDKILGRVFPLLLSPFFIALFLKHYVKAVHRWLMEHSGVAFYIWAFALALVMGQTARSLFNSDASAWWVAFGGLIACALQFFGGKRIGGAYGDRISAGQALGQKNTVLAIWMASAYLHPLAVIAPGAYVLWQNLFNSWQLWKRRSSSSSL